MVQLSKRILEISETLMNNIKNGLVSDVLK